MQQFVVPQFIDVEDKIIGPITVRQFVILLISGGLLFLSFKFADFTLFITEAITIALLTILFAFIKINGRPVHYLILNIIQTLQRPRLRIWDKRLSTEDLKKYMREVKTKPVAKVRTRPLVGTSRLAEISLIVDTGGVYEGES